MLGGSDKNTRQFETMTYNTENTSELGLKSVLMNINVKMGTHMQDIPRGNIELHREGLEQADNIL
jgi:hypothetical protein